MLSVATLVKQSTTGTIGFRCNKQVAYALNLLHKSYLRLSLLLPILLTVSPWATSAYASYWCVGNDPDPYDQNCYSRVRWNDGNNTIGSATQMYATDLLYEQGYFFINAEMWLINTNNNTWIEVGETAEQNFHSELGDPKWFYAAETVYNYDEEPLGIGYVPSADKYNWIPLWLIRDNDINTVRMWTLLRENKSVLCKTFYFIQIRSK